MTRLDEIRDEWEQHGECLCEFAPQNVPTLLSLADALVRLVESRPDFFTPHMDKVTCVYCEEQQSAVLSSPLPHAPDCPWRQAREMMADGSAAGSAVNQN